MDSSTSPNDLIVINTRSRPDPNDFRMSTEMDDLNNKVPSLTESRASLQQQQQHQQTSKQLNDQKIDQSNIVALTNSASSCQLTTTIEISNEEEQQENPYNCEHCTASFYTLNGLVRHIEVFHKSKSESLNAQTNANQYETSNALFKCCGKVFYTVKQMRIHMHMHIELPKYQKVVNLGTVNKSTQNEQTNHPSVHQFNELTKSSNQLPFRCFECGQEFLEEKPLNDHLRNVHSEQSQACEVNWCGREFKRKCDLYRHYRRVHKAVNFPCDHNVEKYQKSRKDLMDHLQTYHSINLDQPKTKVIKSNSIENQFTEQFKCTHCNASFYIESILSLHIEMFHKSKVESINAQTNANQCETNHQSVHQFNELTKSSNQQPFNCPKNLMANHLRKYHHIDFGYPALNSSKCDKSFSHSVDYHVRKVHSQQMNHSTQTTLNQSNVHNDDHDKLNSIPSEQAVTNSSYCDQKVNSNDGQIDDGQIDDGQIDDGQIDDGQHDDGQIDDGQIDDGQIDDEDGNDDDDEIEFIGYHQKFQQQENPVINTASIQVKTQFHKCKWEMCDQVFIGLEDLGTHILDVHVYGLNSEKRKNFCERSIETEKADELSIEQVNLIEAMSQDETLLDEIVIDEQSSHISHDHIYHQTDLFPTPLLNVNVNASLSCSFAECGDLTFYCLPNLLRHTRLKHPETLHPMQLKAFRNCRRPRPSNHVLKIVLTSKIKCSLCDKWFLRQDGLEIHVIQEHMVMEVVRGGFGECARTIESDEELEGTRGMHQQPEHQITGCKESTNEKSLKSVQQTLVDIRSDSNDESLDETESVENASNETNKSDENSIEKMVLDDEELHQQPLQELNESTKSTQQLLIDSDSIESIDEADSNENEINETSNSDEESLEKINLEIDNDLDERSSVNTDSDGEGLHQDGHQQSQYELSKAIYESKSTNWRSFKCVHCDESFEKVDDMEKHYEVFHMVKTVATGGFGGCTITLENDKELERHRGGHQQIKHQTNKLNESTNAKSLKSVQPYLVDSDSNEESMSESDSEEGETDETYNSDGESLEETGLENDMDLDELSTVETDSESNEESVNETNYEMSLDDGIDSVEKELGEQTMKEMVSYGNEINDSNGGLLEKTDKENLPPQLEHQISVRNESTNDKSNQQPLVGTSADSDFTREESDSGEVDLNEMSIDEPEQRFSESLIQNECHREESESELESEPDFEDQILGEMNSDGTHSNVNDSGETDSDVDYLHSKQPAHSFQLENNVQTLNKLTNSALKANGDKECVDYLAEIYIDNPCDSDKIDYQDDDDDVIEVINNAQQFATKDNNELNSSERQQPEQHATELNKSSTKNQPEPQVIELTKSTKLASANCAECGKFYQNKYSLRIHCFNQHPKQTPLCEVSGCERFTFETKVRLIKHYRYTHRGVNFPCKYCYNRENLVADHLRTYHQINFGPPKTNLDQSSLNTTQSTPNPISIESNLSTIQSDTLVNISNISHLTPSTKALTDTMPVQQQIATSNNDQNSIISQQIQHSDEFDQIWNLFKQQQDIENQSIESNNSVLNTIDSEDCDDFLAPIQLNNLNYPDEIDITNDQANPPTHLSTPLSDCIVPTPSPSQSITSSLDQFCTNLVQSSPDSTPNHTFFQMNQNPNFCTIPKVASEQSNSNQDISELIIFHSNQNLDQSNLNLKQNPFDSESQSKPLPSQPASWNLDQFSANLDQSSLDSTQSTINPISIQSNLSTIQSGFLVISTFSHLTLSPNAFADTMPVQQQIAISNNDQKNVISQQTQTQHSEEFEQIWNLFEQQQQNIEAEHQSIEPTNSVLNTIDSEDCDDFLAPIQLNNLNYPDEIDITNDQTNPPTHLSTPLSDFIMSNPSPSQSITSSLDQFCANLVQSSPDSTPNHTLFQMNQNPNFCTIPEAASEQSNSNQDISDLTIFYSNQNLDQSNLNLKHNALDSESQSNPLPSQTVSSNLDQFSDPDLDDHSMQSGSIQDNSTFTVHTLEQQVTELSITIENNAKTSNQTTFDCNSCGKSFKDNISLKGHTRKVHPKHLKYCGVSGCQTYFKTRSGLYRHYRDKHKEVNLPCDQCKILDHKKVGDLMVKHLQTCHQIGFVQLVSSCLNQSSPISIQPNIVQSNSFEQQHQVIDFHEQTTFDCNSCGKSFRDNISLKGHTRKVHPKHLKYCGVSGCQKYFKTKNGLYSHYRDKHKEVNFPCDQCRILENKKVGDLMVKHLQTCHQIGFVQLATSCLNRLSPLPIQPNLIQSNSFEQQHQVIDFNKTTTSNSAPNHIYNVEHQDRVRSNPTQSEVKSNSTLQHTNLILNPTTTFSSKSTRQPEPQVIELNKLTKQTSRNCPDCGKNFANRRSLWAHCINMHPKPSPHCEVNGCGMTFETRIHLMKHYDLVHRGVNFPCKYCYYRKNLTVEHLRTYHQIDFDEIVQPNCHWVESKGMNSHQQNETGSIQISTQSTDGAPVEQQIIILSNIDGQQNIISQQIKPLLYSEAIDQMLNQIEQQSQRVEEQADQVVDLNDYSLPNSIGNENCVDYLSAIQVDNLNYEAGTEMINDQVNTPTNFCTNPEVASEQSNSIQNISDLITFHSNQIQDKSTLNLTQNALDSQSQFIFNQSDPIQCSPVLATNVDTIINSSSAQTQFSLFKNSSLISPPSSVIKKKRSYRKRFILSNQVILSSNVPGQDSRLFICNNCGKTFSKGCNLKTHQKVIHQGKTYTFRCTWVGCGLIFPRKCQLRKHREQAHTGATVYKCDYPECNFSSTKRGIVTQHRKLVHEKVMLMCKYANCGQMFSDYLKLSNHRKSVHTAGGKYKCEVEDCGLGFDTIGHLRRHCERKHKITD